MKKKKRKEIEREGGERSIYRQQRMVCARLQICKAPLHFGAHSRNFRAENGGKVGFGILPCKTAKISRRISVCSQTTHKPGGRCCENGIYYRFIDDSSVAERLVYELGCLGRGNLPARDAAPTAIPARRSWSLPNVEAAQPGLRRAGLRDLGCLVRPRDTRQMARHWCPASSSSGEYSLQSPTEPEPGA
jgi:hypothetical protein